VEPPPGTFVATGFSVDPQQAIEVLAFQIVVGLWISAAHFGLPAGCLRILPELAEQV
jgi:hypothetical protein